MEYIHVHYLEAKESKKYMDKVTGKIGMGKFIREAVAEKIKKDKKENK